MGLTLSVLGALAGTTLLWPAVFYRLGRTTFALSWAPPPSA